VSVWVPLVATIHDVQEQTITRRRGMPEPAMFSGSSILRSIFLLGVDVHVVGSKRWLARIRMQVTGRVGIALHLDYRQFPPTPCQPGRWRSSGKKNPVLCCVPSSLDLISYKQQLNFSSALDCILMLMSIAGVVGLARKRALTKRIKRDFCRDMRARFH